MVGGLQANDLQQAWADLSRSAEKHASKDADWALWSSNSHAMSILLSRQIDRREYCPKPPLLWTQDKEDETRRLLMVPQLADRVVQSALARQMSREVDERLHPDSFAYRMGRGVVQAVERLRELLREKPARMLLDADIWQCFDHVDHHAVFSAVRRLGLWNEQRQWLLERALRVEVESGSVLDNQGRCCLCCGLPQGSPLSPLLSNLVLDALDRALDDTGCPFVRYADNFVVLIPPSASGQEIRDAIGSTLQQAGLRLNMAKTELRTPGDVFVFLGQQVSWTAIATGLPLTGETPVTDGYRQRPAGSGPAERSLRAFLASDLQAGAEPGDFEPLLRTLYLLEPETTLDRSGNQLVVLSAGNAMQKIPAERLHQVMSFSSTHVTSGAISLCLEMGIPVMLLGARGRYFGLIDPIRVDHLHVQRAQFRLLDQTGQVGAIASAFVQGKIANQAAMLRRWFRSRPPADEREGRQLIGSLYRAARKARRVRVLSSLLGIEGPAAAVYWTGVKELLDAEWRFVGRKKRPPPDPVNSLLSYGYTLLYYNLLTLVLARGLHPHGGIYHQPRAGHHALVSDLMEEFRAPLIDALVIDFVQNGGIGPADFVWPDEEGEGCLMSQEVRRRFVHAFERKMNTPTRFGRENLRMDWRRIMDAQVLQLIQVVNGQADRYRPHFIKP